jgi:hypothetical protein
MHYILTIISYIPTYVSAILRGSKTATIDYTSIIKLVHPLRVKHYFNKTVVPTEFNFKLLGNV